MTLHNKIKFEDQYVKSEKDQDVKSEQSDEIVKSKNDQDGDHTKDIVKVDESDASDQTEDIVQFSEINKIEDCQNFDKRDKKVEADIPKEIVKSETDLGIYNKTDQVKDIDKINDDENLPGSVKLKLLYRDVKNRVDLGI